MLRRTGEGKKPLKEKILLLYDALLKSEDVLKENPNFWDEIFLLRTNAEYLEKKFEAFSTKDMIGFKASLNVFFAKCCDYILSDNTIRMINALQTLICLFRSTLTHNTKSLGVELPNLLMENCEIQMQLLLRSLAALLSNTPLREKDQSGGDEDEEKEEEEGDDCVTDDDDDDVQEYPSILKSLSLQLLLTITCLNHNLIENPFIDFLMIEEQRIEQAMFGILVDPSERSKHGSNVLLLLTLLANYRKYESTNPYIMKVSVLDDELALNGFASTISFTLAAFNRQFVSKQEESRSTGLFSTITNMVGSMFIGDSDEQKQLIKTNESVLLALYEAVHLNRNFISVLTHSHTDALIGTPPTTPKFDGSTPNTPTNDLPMSIGTTNNVLCTFIQYTSIVMQDTKMKQNIASAKLCFLILTCITEDQFANSFLHDDNMQFHINIHRMPMRHRKVRASDDGKSRTLACWLFDLTTEFLISHMMKEFPFMQHMRCIGIIHRLMCYQKRCHIRLNYQWKELWSALLTFLKYVISNENNFISHWKAGVFVILTQVLNLFNMFITYGDTFLPSPNSYDELYYEIVRMSQIFESVHALVMKYSTHPEYKEFTYKLANSLINVRSITRHFRPKIDEWSKENNQNSLTEEEVLDVVRSNYDSLTLRLQDNLDNYERYTERPKEAVFFSDLVRSVVQSHHGKNFTYETIDLHQYSSISS